MSEFHPAHKFNLLTGSPLAFRNVIKAFEKWRNQQEQASLTLTTGWHTITQEIAELLLQHNDKNRIVHFPTVCNYAIQLVNGQWKRTGQSLIITDNGKLLDGQHRLWACYLTGKSFETFVVTGVPYDPQLFAWVDNSRPRSAGDALETAGLNGLSKHVASVINDLAHRFDQGGLSMNGRSRVTKLAPYEVVWYMQDHPELMEAAKYVEENHKHAKSRLGPAITTFLAWKIIEVYRGTEALDSFLEAVITADLPTGHPVRLLKSLVSPDLPNLNKKERDRLNARLKVSPLGMNMALAFAITAFNCMQRGELKLSKLPLHASDPFPTIAEPSDSAVIG